ncbi:MAG: phosphopantothenoylcysteine synthetase/decarboxylase [Cognaticolwellia sp.]
MTAIGGARVVSHSVTVPGARLEARISRPVLITAGATRNPIDAMRHISANSSGRTSAHIARALASQTAVTLLGSPQALLRIEEDADGREFGDTRDLLRKMKRWVQHNPGGVVVHAAAVGDYEVRDPSASKVSSQLGEWTLTLHPTPKIADLIPQWDPQVFLVTFKAAGPDTEAEDLAQICRKQLRRTRSQMVFGNVIGALGATSTLVDALGSEAFERREDALSALVARIRAVL